jgi:ethanolamine ammonia-lyase large subunit
MSQKGLDLFGEILMNRVRDEAIDDWERIIEGQIKDEESVGIYNSLSDKEKELIKRLVPKIVDTTLHHLLWTLEQDESVELLINDGTKKENIAEISDGLTGELYTDGGWIYRFSNKAK